MEADGKIVIKLPDGRDLPITNEHVQFIRESKIVHEEKYVPHVIEPSFGIGRIVYCVMEHCFKVRP